MMLGSFRQSGTLRLTVLAICLGIFGFAPPAPSADNLAAGAKKEGELNLYLSTDLSDANGMMQAFRKKYPFVDVKFFRAGNDKLLNRILTEAGAGKFNGDVILISSFEIGVLLQKKLLQKYLSPESSHYPEGFTDKEGYWTSVYSIPRVVAYNTKLVRPDVAPRSYEDMLQPRWKNSFCLRQRCPLVHRLSEILRRGTRARSYEEAFGSKAFISRQ